MDGAALANIRGVVDEEAVRGGVPGEVAVDTDRRAEPAGAGVEVEVVVEAFVAYGAECEEVQVAGEAMVGVLKRLGLAVR